MHPSALPQSVLDRMTARRGRPYAFPSIDPRHTALVVVDMQNGFVAPGAAAEVPPTREIVPNTMPPSTSRNIAAMPQIRRSARQRAGQAVGSPARPAAGSRQTVQVTAHR